MAIITACNKILYTNSLIQKYFCVWFWKNNGEKLRYVRSRNLPHTVSDKPRIVKKKQNTHTYTYMTMYTYICMRKVGDKEKSL